jgi:AraC-like DNA-binding protein
MSMDRFSSADLPVAERKAAYEAALGAYFGDAYVDKNICVDMGQPEAFSASMEPFALGNIRGAVHMSNAPHRLFLAPSDTDTRNLDFYLLLDGEVDFQGEDGPVHLRSGDMTMLRSAEPLSSVSPQMDMIVLSLPERLLGRQLDHRPLAINRRVTGRTSLGACLAALLRTAAQRHEDLSVEERLILQSSVVDAVLHAVSVEPESSGATAHKEAKLRLLKRRALGQLRDPELSPQRLAHETGVSVRTVHRLFHGSGVTFRDWLRERRLERCWEELADPAPGRRTVADVALRWGFNDLTTFNRSFRSKYEVSPTAARSKV